MQALANKSFAGVRSAVLQKGHRIVDVSERCKQALAKTSVVDAISRENPYCPPPWVAPSVGECVR